MRILEYQKHIFVLVALLVISLNLYARMMPNYVKYKNMTLETYDCPFKSFFDNPPSFFNSENGINKELCKSYISYWVIIDNQLFLTGIKNIYSGKKANLSFLFGKNFKNGMVKADWFSGLLHLLGNKSVYRVSALQSAHYEEWDLHFEQGQIVSSSYYRHSKTKKPAFLEDWVLLDSMLHTNINWDIIPPLDKKIRVILRVSSDEQENIEVFVFEEVRKSYNELYLQESVRVIQMLPEWELYYIRGEHSPELRDITIEFSEENRAKYAVPKQE